MKPDSTTHDMTAEEAGLPIVGLLDPVEIGKFLSLRDDLDELDRLRAEDMKITDAMVLEAKEIYAREVSEARMKLQGVLDEANKLSAPARAVHETRRKPIQLRSDDFWDHLAVKHGLDLEKHHYAIEWLERTEEEGGDAYHIVVLGLNPEALKETLAQGGESCGAQ